MSAQSPTEDDTFYTYHTRTCINTLLVWKRAKIITYIYVYSSERVKKVKEIVNLICERPNKEGQIEELYLF